MNRVRPSKRLGQHFLVSKRVARVFSSWVCSYKRVLEIGPGTGFITSRVLRSCGDLELITGIELDQRLLGELSALVLLDNRLSIVIGDAVSPPLRLRAFDAVYGSIPYNITGPLISLLTKYFQKPALLLVQKEVANRLSAKPGSSSYGRLTVLVSLVYSVKKHIVVPPSAFKPRPKVYSQIVELVPIRQIPPNIVEQVEDVTRCFFSQRNKLVRKVATKCLDKCRLSVEEDRRVYELPPSFFLNVVEKCD